MNQQLKTILKKAYITANRMFFSLFFDRKYLRGKYFDVQLVGWEWARQALFWQKILGINRNIRWPVGRDIHFAGNRVHFNPDDINNFQGFGVYYQTINADIRIGKGTYIAPNVGLITSNHDLLNPDMHLPGNDIIIGEQCWIGMNSVVLPGVVLGDHTVVGAGSVVTKSFPDGWCVIAGSPAKVIKEFDQNDASRGQL